MAEDQVEESGAEAAEAEDDQGQAVTREQLEEMVREQAEQYKKEIAGLNRKVSELTQAKQDAEEAGKSEVEKLKERMDQADREKERLRVEAMRERLAHKSGLAADDVDLLTGVDEESVQGQIDRLLARDKKARQEAIKEYDRENGRRLTEKQDVGLEEPEIPKLTAAQMRRLPDSVRAALTR